MKKPDLTNARNGRDEPAVDLARRLARYRVRVEAEGRKRSLGVIDRAIDDASDGGDREAQPVAGKHGLGKST